ncbi:MAG TPA: hypothetical protein VNO30_21120 [Kofleriaceae bacterium]|nr:hypothetical protein [Kofleriaceae bacterium]
MSELAFDARGDYFEVPPAVTGWRVRRMKPRGAPVLVYGREGRPLTVPIESGMEDLRTAVGMPGRYRLEPIDDGGKIVEDVPVSYVQVVESDRSAETSAIELREERDGAVREAMRLNTELAKSVIDRFPEMMKAAAELLRAADGAGIPARLPRLVDVDVDAYGDDDDDDAAPTPPAGFDLNAVVAQLVPAVISGIASGKLKIPGLAAMFDWRKAAPTAATDDSEPAPTEREEREKREPTAARPPRAKAQREPTAESPKESSPSAVELPPIDPKTMAHFVAVQAMLTPEESALAREIAGALEPAALRAWFDDLSKREVAEAAYKIRSFIAGTVKKGEAS